MNENALQPQAPRPPMVGWARMERIVRREMRDQERLRQWVELPNRVGNAMPEDD